MYYCPICAHTVPDTHNVECDLTLAEDTPTITALFTYVRPETVEALKCMTREA